MLDAYSGATRVSFIVGTPIAQVKSPAGVTRSLERLGGNAIVVPAHVSVEDLDDFMRMAARMPNVDCVVVTIPHKFAVARHCRLISTRAKLLGAVNVARKLPDGGWAGDNFDGPGFVEGLKQHGCKVEGSRALLTGAGGAGSAIALELLEQGVSQLRIFDMDKSRADGLASRLSARFPDKVETGAPDPEGFTLIANASPCGMKPDDPMPVDIGRVEEGAFVGDVITAPDPTEMVAAARERGLKTMTGAGMFNAQCDIIAEYILGRIESEFVEHEDTAA